MGQLVSGVDDREYFRIVTAGITDVLVIADAEGRISYITPSVETVLGFSPDERFGRNVAELLHPDDRFRFTAGMRALIEGQTVDADEFRFRHKEGSWRTIELRARNLLADPRVTALVFNGHDVTEQNRTQKELGQLNRLNCLGRLSAQVAHEFNNMLMAMQLSLENLRRRSSGDRQMNSIIERLAGAVTRGKCISRDILRFALPAQTSRERVDVRTFIGQVADEIRSLLPATVELTLDLGDEPLFITGDAAQLSQVFLNLALNARDAMQRGGGTLTIGVRPGRAHTAGFIVDMADADRFVHFNVTDTGEGVAREDLPFIFEPLFTTRKSGTGLGLAVVQQIVAAQAGHIFMESEKGRGTSAHIFLPVGASDERTCSIGPAPSSSVWRIRVLIAEDEPVIAEGLEWSLEETGMQVRVVGRAGDVMPTVESFRPDVVILDLSLADGNGVSVFEQLQARHSIPVIVSTGSEFSPPQGVAVLRKPFTTDELLRTLRLVLGLDESE